MTSPFPELETSQAAIKAFRDAQNLRARQAFAGPALERDIARSVQIIEDPDTLDHVGRRGDFLYRFKQSSAHPRGCWLRLPQDQRPCPDAEWELVFDLDAFCTETGTTWHWRGAATAWFDPACVLLILSRDGSDQCRRIEFDLTRKSFVEGGFDIPPERGSAAWLDPDTLIWASAAGPSAATSSGWPGILRRLKRHQKPEEAEVLMRANPDDVGLWPRVIPDQTGTPQIFVSCWSEIGQEQVTHIHPDGRRTVLPSPADTEVWHNSTHCAYVVRKMGGTPGALLLTDIATGASREIFTPAPRRHIVSGSIRLQDHWLLWSQEDNLRRSLHALDLRKADAEAHQISLPDGTESFWVNHHDANPDGGDGTLQLCTTGFLTPPSTYLFDLTKGGAGITWSPLLQGRPAFDASNHEVQLLEAVSADGTLVPYHLVRPAREDKTPIPVLIYGYGGYGMSLSPSYGKLNGALWLERGCAYVLAHIRGGGELGPQWHDAAKGENRPRAFEDFAAIAQDLVKRGISRPKQIACHGGSNGGLLCGVMLTRYPELFGAVWASAGVYDMLDYHNFPAGRAWIDEYGDPDDPQAAEWLRAYSPLHQVAEASTRPYPQVLIDTSSGDDRVDPSHSRRFAAELQAKGHAPYFIEYGDGGHSGGGASWAVAEEQAIGYQFLLQALTADEEQTPLAPAGREA